MLKNATRRVRRTARRIHIGPGVKSAANYTDTTAGGETADRLAGMRTEYIRAQPLCRTGDFWTAERSGGSCNINPQSPDGMPLT